MTLALTPAPVLAGVTAPARPRTAVNLLVRLALYAFVLSIPFEIPHRAIPLEIPTLTGFVFLFTTLLHPSACYRRVPAPLPWFVAYLAVFVASMIVNDVAHRFQAIKLLISLVQVFLIFWALYNLLAEERILRGVLLALVAACTVRAAIQVLGIATTTKVVWTGGERVTAFGQNANMSAMILAAGLVTVLGLHAINRPRPLRLGTLTWPLAALIGLAMIQTGSRGGLLCAGVGLSAYWFRGHTIWRRLRNGVLGLLAVGALAWGAYHSEMMRNRMEMAAEEGNLAGRERIYPALLEMFQERPWLGWGPIENQYEVVVRMDDATRPHRDAHNLVLELLTTTGLIGAPFFLTGIGVCIAGAWRARGGLLGPLPAGLLAAMLVATISGTWIVSKVLWLALALALSASAHWSPPARAPLRPGGSPRCVA